MSAKPSLGTRPFQWHLLLLALVVPVMRTQAQLPPPNPYKAPLYWSVYEQHILNEQDGVSENYIPESDFLANIDFVDSKLKSSGYNMICMDGWGDVSKKSPNGYRASHSRHWEHDFAWWSSYLQQRGMTLGMYGNPLWMHVDANDASTMIVGTNIPVSSLVDGNDPWWCRVDRPGAEQYVKGYIQYYADMGVKYFRVDFLSWYESGWDRNLGQVGRMDRPHEHYVTALRWMREAADANGMMLSLVMPNLFNEAEVELQSGHMIRINEDAGYGEWWKWSGKNRGVRYSNWSAYANAMDGLTYWSYLAGRGKMILDPDFIRINTFATHDEKQSVISACLLAGAPIAVADQHHLIGNDLWIYTNPEMTALNADGFVGKPKTNDPTLADSQIWSGQMSNGDWIVGLFNREDAARTRSINFSELGGLVHGNVRDLWVHSNLGCMSSFYASIPAHGCRVLKVVPAASTLTGPLAMHVQSLATGTQAAPGGNTLGTATVTIRDDAGNPVIGANVHVAFSGSFREKAFGLTNSSGVVALATTGTASGSIKVTADVIDVTRAGYAYAADQNAITSTGDRMYVAGTFGNWRLKDNPMRWVDGIWQTTCMQLKTGDHEIKFADTSNWSGNDWGSASGLSGTAGSGGPNITFAIVDSGLYTIGFNPITLAYSIQLQWRSEDVGAVGTAGSASYDNDGTFTVLGSGSDIQSTSDELRYVYQTSSGNTEIQARVANVRNTDPWTKAGVMIRESNAGGARYAAVLLTPANGVSFQWRTIGDGDTSAPTIGGVTAPQWLKIVRTSDTFKGYYSSDGVTWTQIGGNQVINMPTIATVGLAVCSHSDGILTTSTMDNVVIGPAPTEAPAQPSPPNTYAYEIGTDATFTWSAVADENGVTPSYRVAVVINGQTTTYITNGTSYTVTGAIGDHVSISVQAVNPTDTTRSGPASPSSATIKLIASDADDDDDGQSNAAEKTAGTNPLDGASVLRVLNVTSPVAASCTITWSSVPGRNYQIQWTSDLKAGFDIPGNTSPIIQASPDIATNWNDSAAVGTRRFYRVKVVP